MLSPRLHEELELGLGKLGRVTAEMTSLAAEFGESARPNLRMLTASVGFLTQFYTGIESILKMIARECAVEVPQGRDWHVQLMELFGPSGDPRCPFLVRDELAIRLGRYRGSRHVMRGAYAEELRWDLMYPALEQAAMTFDGFQAVVQEYMNGKTSPRPPALREPAAPYGSPRVALFLSEAEKAALADIKQRVSALFPVREYILYGSKARGDFGPDSDVDLLIVTERKLTWRARAEISAEVYRANAARDTQYTSTVVFAQEWDSELWQYSPLHRNVVAEGIGV